MRESETAAFIVAEEGGHFRCVAWPFYGGRRVQHFPGRIPEGTVGIVHTHPNHLPFPSQHDSTTAIRLGLPIIVLTTYNIVVATAEGQTIPVVRGESWSRFNGLASSQCRVPGSLASRWAAD